MKQIFLKLKKICFNLIKKIKEIIKNKLNLKKNKEKYIFL